MSVARRLVPGRTHAVVRRTARRCFFLVPTKWVRQLVLYVLGLALLRFPRVKLHALMAESNHIHFVVTDDAPAHEPSELPDFFGLLHSLIDPTDPDLVGAGYAAPGRGPARTRLSRATRGRSGRSGSRQTS